MVPLTSQQIGVLGVDGVVVACGHVLELLRERVQVPAADRRLLTVAVAVIGHRLRAMQRHTQKRVSHK